MMNTERLQLHIANDPVVAFELVQLVRESGYLVKKMNLIAMNETWAHLTLAIDIPQTLLGGLIASLRQHPQVALLLHKNEFKHEVLAFDEE